MVSSPPLPPHSPEEPLPAGQGAIRLSQSDGLGRRGSAGRNRRIAVFAPNPVRRGATRGAAVRLFRPPHGDRGGRRGPGPRPGVQTGPGPARHRAGIAGRPRLRVGLNRRRRPARADRSPAGADRGPGRLQLYPTRRLKSRPGPAASAPVRRRCHASSGLGLGCRCGRQAGERRPSLGCRGEAAASSSSRRAASPGARAGLEFIGGLSRLSPGVADCPPPTLAVNLKPPVESGAFGLPPGL